MTEIDRISHRSALVPNDNLIRPLDKVEPNEVVYIDPTEAVVTHDGMMYLPTKVPAWYRAPHSGLLLVHLTGENEWEVKPSMNHRFETVAEVPDGTWFGVDVVTV